MYPPPRSLSRPGSSTMSGPETARAQAILAAPPSVAHRESDRRGRFEFVMPALPADPAEREKWFASLRDVKNRRREPWGPMRVGQQTGCGWHVTILASSKRRLSALRLIALFQRCQFEAQLKEKWR